MTQDEGTAAVAAPVAPTVAARVALRPLGAGDVRIEGGFWAERQRVNREVTIAHGADRLEESGAFDNLRAAAGSVAGGFRGPRFSDSDVYKWLEAVGWELGRKPSKPLARLARETTGVIAAAQLEDGYLNSYCQLVDPAWRFTDLAMGHELYCAGHLVQAAIAHGRSTGDQTLLAVARRFADYLDGIFGDGRRAGLCGHPEVEMALVELYRFTGERRYLDLARAFIDRRGHGLLGAHPYGSSYFQDHEPVREARKVTGHAVRALYLGCGITDAYLETGDASLLAAAVRQWEDMVTTKTYLTGGVGSRHRSEAFGDAFELPPDRAYCESCAAVASIMWSWRLLLATGEGRFADLIERTLYNGFLAGVSLDGMSFFYVNPLHARGAHERTPWNEVACCPPNIMRLLSSLEQYVATASGDGVQLHQYVGGTIRADTAGAELRVATDYPWDGRIDVVVSASGPDAWTLTLRIPEWCDEAVMSVNGVRTRAERGANGYAEVRREWRSGDRVSLELAMAARLVAAHPAVDAVRGCLALERGPLVYCIEQVDLPSGADVGNVAVVASAEPQVVDRRDLLGGVVTLETAGVVNRTDGRLDWPYRSAHTSPRTTSQSDVRLTAVPYFAWANRSAGPMRVWIPEV